MIFLICGYLLWRPLVWVETFRKFLGFNVTKCSCEFSVRYFVNDLHDLGVLRMKILFGRITPRVKVHVVHAVGYVQWGEIVTFQCHHWLRVYQGRLGLRIRSRLGGCCISLSFIFIGVFSLQYPFFSELYFIFSWALLHLLLLVYCCIIVVWVPFGTRVRITPPLQDWSYVGGSRLGYRG